MLMLTAAACLTLGYLLAQSISVMQHAQQRPTLVEYVDMGPDLTYVCIDAPTAAAACQAWASIQDDDPNWRPVSHTMPRTCLLGIRRKSLD